MVSSSPGLNASEENSIIESTKSADEEHGSLTWNPSAPSFVPFPPSGFEASVPQLSPNSEIPTAPELGGLLPERLNELHQAAQHLAADLQHSADLPCADVYPPGLYEVNGVKRSVGSASLSGAPSTQVPTATNVAGAGLNPTGSNTPDDVFRDLPPFTIVTSMNDAVDICRHIETLGPALMTLDCEGVNLSATGKLTLVQIAVSTGQDICHCYLFDVEALGRIEVLRGILENPSIVKVIHDVYRDAASLYHQHHICLSGILDTQLVYEFMTGEMLASMRTVVRWLGEFCPNKDEGRELMRKDPEVWARRPLSSALIRYAVNDVAVMHKAARTLVDRIGSNMAMLIHASVQRCRWSIDGDLRCISFCGNRLTSRELRDYRGDYEVSPVQIEDDMESIFANLPPHYRGKLMMSSGPVQFIMLDLGAPARASYHHEATLGCRGTLVLDTIGQAVTKKVLRLVEASLEEFNVDGRCCGPGIDGTLHRISRIRSVSGQITGITFKIGRAVLNNCNLFPDILFSTKNLLVCGLPHSGKTTLLREMCRKLSQQRHVVCVDTANEIFGDSEKVHRGVGYARRMPVPNNVDQVEVLREAIRNHSPEVLICDYISDPRDIDSMMLSKSRGIRLITSSCGTLADMMENSAMQPFLGLGPSGKWGHRIRTHAPLFDVIIECTLESFNRVRIFTDVTRSVESMLLTGSTRSEVRHRNNAGEISLELHSAGANFV